MQFYRHSVGAKDLPMSEKKDQLYLVLEGLDRVDFGTKEMLDCLEGVQVGVKNDPNKLFKFSWGRAFYT